MSELALVIITPIWQENPSRIELERLQFSLKRNPNYKHFFIAPKNLNVKSYIARFPFSDYLFFDANYFDNIQTYNLFMLSPDLYESFREYEFMMILQLDAILVNPISIQDFYRFDYVGAPWQIKPSVLQIGNRLSINSRLSRTFGVRLPIGNGGLSIRRTKVFLDCFLDKEIKKVLNRTRNLYPSIPNEDVVWSFLLLKKNSCLPSPKQAEDLFMESGAILIDKAPDRIIGFHDLETYNQKLENRILNREY